MKSLEALHCGRGSQNERQFEDEFCQGLKEIACKQRPHCPPGAICLSAIRLLVPDFYRHRPADTKADSDHAQRYFANEALKRCEVRSAT
jgi:hypothetical protein